MTDDVALDDDRWLRTAKEKGRNSTLRGVAMSDFEPGCSSREPAEEEDLLLSYLKNNLTFNNPMV